MIVLIFNLVPEDFYVGFEAALVEDGITLGKLRSLLICSFHALLYAKTMVEFLII
jgi:hypothetical protein